MAGLRGFRTIPENLREWGRWFAAQDLHVNDDSSFTGNLTGLNVKRGTGSPENNVTGNVSDIYQRTDGGTSTSMYVKESGTGKTGWIAK